MRYVTCIVLLGTCVLFGGVAFGVNPVSSLPETYIGYKFGPVVPSLSVNYLNLNGSFTFSEEWSDGDSYVTRADWKAGVLTPTIGAKLLFGDSDLQPYLRISTGLPLLASLDVIVTDEDAQGFIEELIEDIKGGTKQPMIITGAAGVEFFPVERFSVGGEFLYRYATVGFFWDYYEDYGGGDWERYDVDVRTSLGGTTAGLWLNYYF
ncbi:hypothetical protein JXM67_14480 [candidate division WOR-3 bacterium]|nr:hypothetical protein [candidate division WOR-3 bacterium]